MKNNIVLLVLLFIAIVACQQSNVSIDTFDKVSEITVYDSIYSDEEDALGVITDIEIWGDVLVAKHMRDEYSFSFISVANGKLIQRWGKRGEGRDEFLDFGSGFTIKDSLLVFVEQMKKSINYASIQDILNARSIINIVKENYPYNVDFRPMRFCFLDNQKVAVGAFKEGRLGVLDSNNNIVDCYYDYPFNCGKVEGLYRGSVFQCDIKSNKKHDMFAISTYVSDVFEIFQVSDDGIYRIFVSPFRNEPKIWEKGGRFAIDYDNCIAGLMKMAVSDDLICFTYSSLSYTEAAAKDITSKEILCFNWKGEKVKKYILPFPISNFCVDEHYIYGVRYFDDKTVIYRFGLS